jgi:hypothetical protein
MNGNLTTAMITLPPGQVTLSDRRTQRVWSVELAPYQLAALPITQAQYVDLTGQRPSAAEGDQLPVVSVFWWDAVRFCNARSERDGFAAPTICKPTAMASSGTPPLTATGERGDRPSPTMIQRSGPDVRPLRESCATNGILMV